MRAPLCAGGLASVLLLSGCGSPVRPAQGAADLGPAPASERVFELLTLRSAAGGPAAAAAAIYKPGSPAFLSYLTPGRFDAGYAPSAALIGGLRASAAPAGLRLSWTPGAESFRLEGGAGDFERALGVSIHDYRSRDGSRYYASLQPPRLPAAIAAAVLAPGRISDYVPPLRNLAIPAGGLRPLDVRAAYDTAGLRERGFDGSGETVVFWSLGDGFQQSDFDTFSRSLGLPAQKVTVVGAPNKGEGETIMDLEVVHAIAPGARLVVYTGGTGAAEEQVMDHVVGDNPGAILSHSWGTCELGDSDEANYFSSLYQKAAALGDSVFVSTGDSGGYECLDGSATSPGSDGIGASLPASVPWVTAVGGTALSVRKDGSWYSERPWTWPTATEGTGGGVSTLFPRPAWQQGPGVQNRYNARGMRSVPDVSADADSMTGLRIYSDGTWQQGGGTSQSAPIWAGITALIDQYLKKQGLKQAGFLNPALYAIAAGHPPLPAFHDISEGGNLVYPATPGYDLATGLGTPDAWNLAQDLAAYQRNGGRV